MFSFLYFVCMHAAFSISHFRDDRGKPFETFYDIYQDSFTYFTFVGLFNRKERNCVVRLITEAYPILHHMLYRGDALWSIEVQKRL